MLVVTLVTMAPPAHACALFPYTTLFRSSLAPSTFNDLGTRDTHTATIDWGDGTVMAAGVVSESPFGPPGSTAGANGTGRAYHGNPDNQSYRVTAAASNDDGAATSDTLVV